MGTNTGIRREFLGRDGIIRGSEGEVSVSRSFLRRRGQQRLYTTRDARTHATAPSSPHARLPTSAAPGDVDGESAGTSEGALVGEACVGAGHEGEGAAAWMWGRWLARGGRAPRARRGRRWGTDKV